MKLNKILVAAAAVAVLPLSVAHAVEEAPVVEKPEVVFDANGQPVIKDGKFETRPSVTQKGTSEVADEKPTVKVLPNGQVEGKISPAVHNVPEFKGGVNGAEAAVAEKPEYKAEKAQKPAKRVLPKTHAVK
jgi:hypothetical protein